MAETGELKETDKSNSLALIKSNASVRVWPDGRQFE